MKAYPFLASIMTALLVASLLLSGCASTEKSDWKILKESNYGGEFSYDAASIRHTSAGTVTAWAANDAGKFLYELDCNNRKARIIEGPGGGDTGWFVIVNNSADELLYRAICK